MKHILTLIIILLFNQSTFAGEVKLRAREHYEILKIKNKTDEAEYTGLTNTINLWWEKPYDLSFGLSYSPILSNFEETDKNSFLGKKIKTIHFGLEAKIFETELFNYFYLRPGLSYTILKTDLAIENKVGFSTYLGLGYEIPFKQFGLSLEVAYRYSQLEDNFTIDTISPSIGLHFYKKL